MASSTKLLLLLCAPALVLAQDRHEFGALFRFWRRARSVPPEGFYNPNDNGGSFITVAPNTDGLGEPLNAIVSGNSDAAVLVDSEKNGGFRNYMLAVGFAGECLGQHSGQPQTANLGDGRGKVNETAVLRWHYGNPQFGTCKESIMGGNHFRYWSQTGSNGDSGAYFLATSSEKPIEFAHDIIFNGYNLGRDWMVGNATAQSTVIPTANLTNGTTYSGQISFANYTYQTDAIYLAGLIPNTSEGINHAPNISPGPNGTGAVDGLVAVLTVKIVGRPDGSASSALLARPTWVPLTTLFALAVTLALSL